MSQAGHPSYSRVRASPWADAFLGIVPFYKLSALALASHSTGRCVVSWPATLSPEPEPS